MPILYILCGASGSGKSTWAQSFIKDAVDTKWVSRDKIRFSLLKEDEDYFAHEKEVFTIFVKSIVDGLKNDWNVIADATHLNIASRKKLIQGIDTRGYKNYEIVYVIFNTDVNTCIERNKAREGRSNVPESTIRNMCRDFRAPTKDEDERIVDIIEVGDDK